MEKNLVIAWRRRISLWGTMLAILVYLPFLPPIFIPLKDLFYFTLNFLYFIGILYFVIVPIMEIIGIAPLMRQPVPERFMHRKVLVYGMRLFLLLVYASQLFVIYATIMNMFFLS